jgi:hypothetical protein
MEFLDLGVGSVPSLASGSAPVNTLLPTISGALVDNSAWDFNIGTWSGPITGFDVQVETTDPTPVILVPRSSVTGDSDGTITSAVGKSIVLKVWAKNGIAETLRSSSPFGPIAGSADLFVLAVATAISPQSWQTTPYPVTGMFGANLKTAQVIHNGVQISATGNYGIDNPNPGMIGLRFGMNGSTDLGAGSGVSINTYNNPHLNGRLTGNSSAVSAHLRIDLPGAGTYRIYAGLGSASTITNVNFGVWEGAPTTTSAYQLPPTTRSDRTFVVDATGVALSEDQWGTTAPMNMGNFVEITVTGAAPFITIGRSTAIGSSTSMLNCFAVFKRV